MNTSHTEGGENAEVVISDGGGVAEVLLIPSEFEWDAHGLNNSLIYTSAPNETWRLSCQPQKVKA